MALKSTTEKMIDVEWTPVAMSAIYRRCHVTADSPGMVVTMLKVQLYFSQKKVFMMILLTHAKKMYNEKKLSNLISFFISVTLAHVTLHLVTLCTCVMDVSQDITVVSDVIHEETTLVVIKIIMNSFVFPWKRNSSCAFKCVPPDCETIKNR